MLDTVALSLKPNEFQIMDHAAFSPSSGPIFIPPYYRLRRGGISCKNNPSKKNTQLYGYMPRLTLSKRPMEKGFSILLRVEASMPKLKFGNNFDELTNDDFDYICERLVKQMKYMGVYASEDAIKNADVSAIHYSKNLPLTDYTSASMVIKEVAKGVVSRQLTGSKTDYDNDGSAFKLHANSYEIILYDKIKDYQRSLKSPKRAKDFDKEELTFGLSASDFQKQFDVLRLEVRLGNRKKIQDAISKVDSGIELKFKNLFNESVAKGVLMNYWKKLTPDLDLVVCSGFPAGELYDAIYSDNPELKPTQILQIIGGLSIVQNDGMEGLRTRFERNSSPHSWYGYKKKLNGLSVSSHMRYNPVRIAQQHLEEFVPLRLDDYKVDNTKNMFIN